LDLDVLIHILAGSTFGLILRLFIKYNFKKRIGFNLNNTSIVNILASLFLGILVALNPFNKNLFFLFYIGFLGCFSTFSSFIYELFNLIQNRKYLLSFFHYIEVLILSFLSFSGGYFIILIFKT
tara:strand:- start:81 stop:452 length:372 start_codon:yes stop_codon:yes gene_type:complete